MTMTHDTMFRAVRAKHINALVSWYLMASVLYYCCDISLLSDELYDQIARDLIQFWDDLDHPHKRLLDKDALSAGTNYHMKVEDYPSGIKCAAYSLIRNGPLDRVPNETRSRLLALPPEAPPVPVIRKRTRIVAPS